MRPRRSGLLIGVAGAVFGLGCAAAGGVAVKGVLLCGVLGAALGPAQRRPRVAWLTATAALLGLGADVPSGTPFFLVPAHAFCAGRWDTRWSGAVGTAALLAATLFGLYLAGESVFVPYVVITVAAWIAARAFAEHERVAAQLAQRAQELEEEREAHAALSVRYEQARIASELHDIVAHAISVMVVQASAGQRLAGRDPEGTAQTFENLADAARQAEEDMGRLVALLSAEDAIGEAPDLALVEELVQRAAGSGLNVTLRLEGTREGLPAPVVHVACRVAQEGLTNALRYASGAAVSVVVRGEPSGLTVEVVNTAAPGEPALGGAGTGHGLQGLRERVGACGGSFDAGPTADGGWRISARLPRRAVASAARQEAR